MYGLRFAILIAQAAALPESLVQLSDADVNDHSHTFSVCTVGGPGLYIDLLFSPRFSSSPTPSHRPVCSCPLLLRQAPCGLQFLAIREVPPLPPPPALNPS